MSKTVPISMIIPTMNRPESLKRTLASYAAGEVIPEQTVLVDQSQQEPIRRQIQAIAQAFGAEYYVQAIPSSTKARNEGIAHARHEIIVFSDDDIDVYTDTVGHVYRAMQDPMIALIGGLDDNSGLSSSNIGYLLGTKSFRKRKIGHVTRSVLGRYPDHVQGTVDTEWAMGYFFVVRKSLLDKWQMRWDERLISYAYAEDLDFSFRYCKYSHSEGLQCLLSDEVRMKHLASKEYRVPTRKSTYMYAIHRRYLSDKNGMGSHLAMGWCDFWRIVQRMVRHEEYGELIDAVRMADKLRRDNYTGMEETIRNV